MLHRTPPTPRSGASTYLHTPHPPPPPPPIARSYPLLHTVVGTSNHRRRRLGLTLRTAKQPHVIGADRLAPTAYWPVVDGMLAVESTRVTHGAVIAPRIPAHTTPRPPLPTVQTANEPWAGHRHFQSPSEVTGTRVACCQMVAHDRGRTASPPQPSGPRTPDRPTSRTCRGWDVGSRKHSSDLWGSTERLWYWQQTVNG